MMFGVLTFEFLALDTALDTVTQQQIVLTELLVLYLELRCPVNKMNISYS